MIVCYLYSNFSFQSVPKWGRASLHFFYRFFIGRYEHVAIDQTYIPKIERIADNLIVAYRTCLLLNPRGNYLSYPLSYEIVDKGVVNHSSDEYACSGDTDKVEAIDYSHEEKSAQYNVAGNIDMIIEYSWHPGSQL